MSPLLLAFLLTKQNASTPTAAPTEVPFRTLSFGSNGKIKDGGAVVLRDAKAFNAYRAKMGTADQKRPTVDWSKEQVVAIHAAGVVGYGPSSIHVLKVLKKPDGSLEVSASVDPGNRPATPTPGVMPVLKREGLYTLIVVPPAQGAVTLRVEAAPASSGDRTGTPGSR